MIMVVVCEEERVENAEPVRPSSNSATLSTQDLMEMQGDVDRLVDKITGNMSSLEETTERTVVERLEQSSPPQQDDSNSLSPHTISLLELSSGIWLGDSIIRDIPMVPVSPFEKSKGFGDPPSKKEKIPFASWSVGVQKVARRWMWNFGEEIRQVNDFGKAMGAEMAEALTKDLSGSVCVNEGLSRRIPTDERMVYIDWSGDNVGFLVGSHSIQLPRYLNFDRTRQLRPFSTEFCVYQKADRPEEADALPEVVCSKIERVYNYEGSLKQGCTSFFTFQRFGEGDE